MLVKLAKKNQQNEQRTVAGLNMVYAISVGIGVSVVAKNV